MPNENTATEALDKVEEGLVRDITSRDDVMAGIAENQKETAGILASLKGLFMSKGDKKGGEKPDKEADEDGVYSPDGGLKEGGAEAAGDGTGTSYDGGMAKGMQYKCPKCGHTAGPEAFGGTMAKGEPVVMELHESLITPLGESIASLIKGQTDGDDILVMLTAMDERLDAIEKGQGTIAEGLVSEIEARKTLIKGIVPSADPDADRTVGLTPYDKVQAALNMEEATLRLIKGRVEDPSTAAPETGFLTKKEQGLAIAKGLLDADEVYAASTGDLPIARVTAVKTGLAEN